MAMNDTFGLFSVFKNINRFRRRNQLKMLVGSAQRIALRSHESASYNLINRTHSTSQGVINYDR